MAPRMRTALLSIGLLLFLLAALVPTEVSCDEKCAPENCMSEDKCSLLRTDVTCPNAGEKCCNIVKAEFRTHCSHHGGECLDYCNQTLQRSVNDCPPQKFCCILVR